MITLTNPEISKFYIEDTRVVAVLLCGFNSIRANACRSCVVIVGVMLIFGSAFSRIDDIPFTKVQ